MDVLEVFLPIVYAILGAVAVVVIEKMHSKYASPKFKIHIRKDEIRDMGTERKFMYTAVVENTGKRTTENLVFSAYFGDNWGYPYHSTKCVDINPGARIHFDIANWNDGLIVPGGIIKSFPLKIIICISTKDVKQQEFVYVLDEKGDITNT